MSAPVTLSAELVRSWLPARDENGHKGTFGKVCILAGSEDFTGAPVLASRAAVRGGTGLVFLLVPRCVYPIVAVKCDEAMPSPLPCSPPSWNVWWRRRKAASAWSRASSASVRRSRSAPCRPSSPS